MRPSILSSSPTSTNGRNSSVVGVLTQLDRRAGDAGFRDRHGYLHIMSRTDDIINVAGHRLSTGALEEACLAHEQVGDGGTTARSVTELARMWCVCSWCGMA